MKSHQESDRSSKETLRPHDLLERFAREQATGKQLIRAAEQKNASRSQRIGALVEQRTNAFIELSRHYLPELSYEAAENAWSEVRDEIRQQWLLKQDRRRTLEDKREELECRRAELENRRELLQVECDEARNVLACKTGNVNKRMRDDPELVAIRKKITSIDAAIEQKLDQLDFAEQEAAAKLPAYEESSLFSYLNERGFGTSRYEASGWEKRWDRWVAKLVGYRDAKKSYDHLTQTPEYLRQLIDEKQSQYRRLLETLDSTRSKLRSQQGIEAQTDAWNGLQARLSEIDTRIEELRWKEAVVEDDLVSMEDLNGPYYQQAIMAYRDFLTDLEPAALDVYAQCTASPVDDQICARLREIDSKLRIERETSKSRAESIEETRQYVANVADLTDRLRRRLREIRYDAVVSHDFCPDDILERVRTGKSSTAYAWRLIRGSIIPVATMVADLYQPPTRPALTQLIEEATAARNRRYDQLLGPLDSALLVADHDSNSAMTSEAEPLDSPAILGKAWEFQEIEGTSAGDRARVGNPGAEQEVPWSEITLVSPSDHSEHFPAHDSDRSQFCPLAFCTTETVAVRVRQLLQEAGIDSFVCDSGDPVEPERPTEYFEGEQRVLVRVSSYMQAYRKLSELRRSHLNYWSCPGCEYSNKIEVRFCSACGRPRAI